MKLNLSVFPTESLKLHADRHFFRIHGFVIVIRIDPKVGENALLKDDDLQFEFPLCQYLAAMRPLRARMIVAISLRSLTMTVSMMVLSSALGLLAGEDQHGYRKHANYDYGTNTYEFFFQHFSISLGIHTLCDSVAPAISWLNCMECRGSIPFRLLQGRHVESPHQSTGHLNQSLPWSGTLLLATIGRHETDRAFVVALVSLHTFSLTLKFLEPLVSPLLTRLFTFPLLVNSKAVISSRQSCRHRDKQRD